MLLIFLAVLFLPSTARADAGIPMLPIAYPLVLLFLVHNAANATSRCMIDHRSA
jgi:uncharacterized membrane protein YfcA